MDIEPAQSFGVQLVAVDDAHRFVMTSDRRLRKHGQQGEYLDSVLQAATGQLTDDKRVTEDPTLQQECLEFSIAPAEVIDPDGGIDEYQAAPVRRRGVGFSFFSVPPRAARRRALASAMSASRPIRTSAVFSLMPVSSSARASSLSSMFNVVLICTSMHARYIPCKHLSTAALRAAGTGPNDRHRRAESFGTNRGEVHLLTLDVTFHSHWALLRRR
jgi:hypothetical protein